MVAALFVLFLASGAALAYVMGAAAVLSFIASGNIRYLAVLPQRIFSSLDIFALMAMVLFIMAGEVMNRTGEGIEIPMAFITVAVIIIFIHLAARLFGSQPDQPKQ